MELQAIIAGVIAKHCKVIESRVKARWDGQSGIQGLEEIHSDLPTIIGTLVVAEITASGDAAWIKEFGSGHLLDESSPYFADYKNSDRWNPRRSADGNEFVGRSAGSTIYRPDGTTSTSTGRGEGLRLEHDIGKSGKYPAYKAFKPQHIIKEEITAAIPELV